MRTSRLRALRFGLKIGKGVIGCTDCALQIIYRTVVHMKHIGRLGYKMVKYLRSIEVVADYCDIGDGQGGSREDTMFYGRGAEI